MRRTTNFKAKYTQLPILHTSLINVTAHIFIFFIFFSPRKQINISYYSFFYPRNQKKKIPTLFIVGSLSRVFLHKYQECQQVKKRPNKRLYIYSFYGFSSCTYYQFFPIKSCLSIQRHVLFVRLKYLQSLHQVCFKPVFTVEIDPSADFEKNKVGAT